MRTFKLCFVAILLISVNSVFAQTGFIRGTVYDDANGETIIGATIRVEGTEKGAMTDLDGKFSISVVEGVYTVKLTFISFETLVIEGVTVKANEATVLDNLRMKTASQEITEVVVKAEAVRNSENSLITLKKKSPNLIDGISAGNFKKIGDSDAAAAIKRVPGVSITGGKYVFVRGLGDRYSKTMLNGMDIPGLDPDRNTLQMDIFPTNVIDNLVVHKSFVAELPADFTGGVVDIAIKEFPDSKKGSFSVAVAYNPNFHFKKNYLTYDGGKTDFLGFDDGTRDIPATSDIPFYTQAIANTDGPKAERYKEILNAFNPTMAAELQTSMMDFGFGFDIGNQKAKERATLGYNFVFSYKNETEFYQNAEFGRYGLSGDASETEMEMREFQVGDYGVNSILMSGMAGFAVKTAKSKYKINFLHLQNGESKAGIFDYENNDQGAEFVSFQHNLEYSGRSITNALLYGKHDFSEKNWEVEWKLSPTYSKMDDPDIRFTRYRDDNGSVSIGTEAGFPQRIWRELDEINMAGALNVTKDAKFKRVPAKFKFGSAYTYKTRDFVLRSYNLNIRNIPLTGNPNELFFPENLWPYQDDVARGTTYEATFMPVNPNQFEANNSNIAAYASAELTFFKFLKTIVGLRTEYFTQRYTGQDQLGYNKLNNDKVLDDLDFFPSVNVVYNINLKNNLRASFSQTVARPSFKELSYAEIYDPITGRTFIGGLFRDANDAQGIEYWDGNLTSTYIQNFDLRWEFFPNAGQMISVGAFYKRFNDPIEVVQFVQQAGAFQPRNVGDAQLIGGEFELRQSLEFISKKLTPVSIVFNFTLTDSKIKLSKTEYDSRVENARTGQEIDEYRNMAGQAPYMVNCGLAYNGGENGFWKGFEAGLYYNVQGRTLQYVGIADRPDIYSNPFNSLNFNMNKSFGKNDKMQFGVKVENILNDKNEYIFRAYESADQYFTRLEPGVKVQARFSYKFF